MNAIVSLDPVDADDPRLERLLQLYIHEWSGRIPIAIGHDGRFEYDDLEGYRDRETRAAFLFTEPTSQAPLGFALAVCDETAGWSVEEFFVIAGARRRGIGHAAAEALFAARPGRWTLTVREENADALPFWRRVAPDADEQIEPGADGVVRTRLSFARFA